MTTLLNGFSVVGHTLRSISITRFMSSATFRPLVVCGPSGSGKSTLLRRLLAEFPDYFRFSISHTTRKPRSEETDGKDYYFIERKTFEKMICENRFVEFATFSDHLYGTSFESLSFVQKSNRIPVLDLDINGIRSLKNQRFFAKYLFIRAPNVLTLERNLRNRGSEDETSLRKRLLQAVQDMEFVDKNPMLFDVIIINKDLEEAYCQLKSCLSDDIKALKEFLWKKS
ncbi:guanylate kinase-like [Oppia nitens]|uniref:guanylate kinase-like n=1 Tax=Oppia nitens TaxID=1686743 RepID=UPI0023DA447C|nr:guanylate kinase-like [Oppia nitens]